ncbi:MAG: phospholipid carrier-dependent glycosyltransferase [Xanthomonadales bacterium]|nr:phospholipid carrier-dependent glycosyltransferase [Xanthomonadales bacterium]
MSDRSGPDHPIAAYAAPLLILVLLVRLVTMAWLPVTDTTEARYAEITRLMVESGHWLVPPFEPGVPFWGKPPLFAWLSGAMMKLAGLSEFAIRLPHFLLSLLTLWLTARLGAEHLPGTRRWLCLLVLATCPLFFIASATVMTESSLLLSTTLAMAGFWRGAVLGERAWGWVLFAGLGLGMLAKGPVAPALSLLPISMWLLATRRWRDLERLPWMGGVVLCVSIFAPWYIAAEQASPGFLSYFIVGEHVLRFIQPGWEGDLYGNPHREWPGTIWLFWFQATALWGVMFAWSAWQAIRGRTRIRLDSAWHRYLLSWLLAPLLFFTFSGNILWTYVITGLPALALLLCSRPRADEAAR